MPFLPARSAGGFAAKNGARAHHRRVFSDTIPLGILLKTECLFDEIEMSAQ
jgi:hypothetical protein